MHRILIVVEKAGKNFSAYSPDLTGCVATGKTRERAEEQMHEAIAMHIRGLLEDSLPVPKSHSSATFIAVRAE
jgi:predicted RNase H-like HicB family nuclease